MAVVAAALAIASPEAQSKFTLKVHTGRGQIGYDVNSTMVIDRVHVVEDPRGHDQGIVFRRAIIAQRRYFGARPI